ncbi:hypothetical protein SYNTR_0858 [Candidatus Syntrophocurvum alkaliphilum]|uniref:Uncharacterized protein n=1 Tax=Candidatus Syntrophocurvum alkaliphilum TaxID=2293317 RepID=A0A6I6DIY1_9FIRM|nr:hypothetical protein SYNTR_0858 [Candidatus Syntrophocurvum alkaliphilum]
MLFPAFIVKFITNSLYQGPNLVGIYKINLIKNIRLLL